MDTQTMRRWNGELADDNIRTDTFIVGGYVAGGVQQFPTNEPTTYAWAGEKRLGPFSSWEDAKSAVEKNCQEGHP